MKIVKSINQKQTHFTDENTRVRILDDRERLLLIRKSYYDDLLQKISLINIRKKDLIYNYREQCKEIDKKLFNL